MKKVLTIITLLCSLLLVTGCGETEEDKINSTDPKKFAVESFKEKYDVDIEVSKHSKEYYKYSQSDRGYEYEKYEVKTIGDEQVSFLIATYWEVSDAIPTKHYVYSTNYENIVNKNILEEYFKDNNDILFDSSKKDIKLYGYTPEYEFKLTVMNSDALGTLANTLYDLSCTDNLYDLNLKVTYNGKNVNISLSNDIELSVIEKKVNSLQ